MTTPAEFRRDPATLDLYKLAVEMADRVSARRGATNSFYLTLQSALLTALGFLTSGARTPDRWVLVGVCGAGVATSATWFLLLRSYRDLNRAKYAVIVKMEAHLPHSVFGDEWQSLKEDPIPRWRPRYAEFGTIERVVPGVFLVINILLAIYLGSI